MARIAWFVIGFFLLLYSCDKIDENIDFKEEMRSFVIGISEYSKAASPGFIVIPQNGIELVTHTGEENGTPHTSYLGAIDGNGQEDLFYGYDKDDKATPDRESEYLSKFLTISKNSGKIILVTDYCSTLSKMDDSYSKNHLNSFVPFAADHRELDNIPLHPNPIYSQNDQQISELSQIQNFLYLINPENFSKKTDFINAITSTNYDLVILDLFFRDGVEFTSSEIDQLKQKQNGGTRMVVAYMSIGEAEDYRYYWQSEWSNHKPAWMDKENPNWEGNFKVKYWDKDWQNIIYGTEDSYLDKVLKANFDGIYLDIIDAFQYYE